MTTDSFADISGATATDGYLAAGSPGRMAALLLLGTRPDGVSSVEIRSAIRAADARVYDEERLSAVLRQLREAGLASTERCEAGVRWYSPASRHAARLRRALAMNPAAARTTAATTTDHIETHA